MCAADAGSHAASGDRKVEIRSAHRYKLRQRASGLFRQDRFILCVMKRTAKKPEAPRHGMRANGTPACGHWAGVAVLRVRFLPPPIQGN